MEQIQIFTFKADHNTATLKRINATRIENTNIYYTEQVEKYGLNYYFYYFDIGDKKCCLFETCSTNTPEKIKEWYKDNSEKCSIVYYFERLKNKLATKQWTSNLDIFICEHLGEHDLAKECSENRQAILQQREQERLKQEREQELKEQQRKAEQEQQLKNTLSRAKNNLLDNKGITPEEFELLCKDQNISLTPKFIGWLREYCGDIYIQARTQQELDSLPKGVVFTNAYKTRYYCQKGHKSTKLSEYADKLAVAIGL